MRVSPVPAPRARGIAHMRIWARQVHRTPRLTVDQQNDQRTQHHHARAERGLHHAAIMNDKAALVTSVLRPGDLR
jgi:hypothetical protein